MGKLLWVDVETTGLDPDEDEILELGMRVTNEKLESLGLLSYVFYHSLGTLERKCAPFVKEMHKKSGLWDAVLIPKDDMHYGNVYRLSERFVKTHFPDSKPVIAGNSVHFDRGFLKHFSWEKLLHHRMIDVSSIYEAFKFSGRTFDKVELPHRVVADIDGSIKLFREMGFGQ